MCGIAGIWFRTSQNVGTEVIKKMTDVIYHRGPDGEGFAELDDGRLFLGHRRLSIIDLTPAGNQPMEYMNRYTITYNGEIYNYLELREILQSKGYRFYSATDTEVIMAAYDCWGIDCLQKFDGMFAFALYDKNSHELFCARDRFGEKPFHYFEGNDFFVFGSEMKSLWAAEVDKTPDDYSIYLFLNMELHEDPEDKSRTFFKNIKRLKPGHYFRIKNSEKIYQEQYWKINFQNKQTNISFEEACLKFRELFEISVNRRLRSDVPVGTSLSGGLDSSAVALMLHKVRNPSFPQKCFSARFNDSILDEGYFMQKVVEGTSIEHFETWPDAMGLIANFEKLLYHQEEPFGTASIYAQWEVFKLAKEKNVTVLLDGQGADEVLAGYTHFFLPFFREIFLRYGHSRLKQEYRYYLENNIVEKPIPIDLRFKLETQYPSLVKSLRAFKSKNIGVNKSKEISDSLYKSFKHKKTPFIQFNTLNDALDYFTTISGLDKLLRFADRNSMAHSREVRLPFLFHELVEFVFSLPSDYKIKEGWTKALLRHGLKDMIPQEIVWRKNKLGFQPPQKQWEKSQQFITLAKECKNVGVKYKYLSLDAPLNWKTLVLGIFLEI
jgi:asparagine synthase (glutamine-hydrolysing)